jgi:hypothetical protein
VQAARHVGGLTYDPGVNPKILAVAGVIFGVLAYSAHASPEWVLAAVFGGPLACVFAVRAAVALVCASRASTHVSRSFSTGISGSAFQTVRDRVTGIDAMSGMQFEDYVAQAARSCGLPVIMTAATGDWGVDLIVGYRPKRLAIQCKRQNRPVGTTAVQEVVAGAPMQGCTKTMVVSNQEFTAAARKLAGLHGCVLVGGSQLARLAAHIRRAVLQAE